MVLVQIRCLDQNTLMLGDKSDPTLQQVSDWLFSLFKVSDSSKDAETDKPCTVKNPPGLYENQQLLAVFAGIYVNEALTNANVIAAYDGTISNFTLNVPTMGSATTNPISGKTLISTGTARSWAMEVQKQLFKNMGIIKNQQEYTTFINSLDAYVFDCGTKIEDKHEIHNVMSVTDPHSSGDPSKSKKKKPKKPIIRADPHDINQSVLKRIGLGKGGANRIVTVACKPPLDNNKLLKSLDTFRICGINLKVPHIVPDYTEAYSKNLVGWSNRNKNTFLGTGQNPYYSSKFHTMTLDNLNNDANLKSLVETVIVGKESGDSGQVILCADAIEKGYYPNTGICTCDLGTLTTSCITGTTCFFKGNDTNSSEYYIYAGEPIELTTDELKIFIHAKFQT